MSGAPSLTILSEEQKFNGENLLTWTTNMIQLLGSKGLSGYIDRRIPKPTRQVPGIATPTGQVSGTTTPTRQVSGTVAPDPTPIYSSTPSLDEWTFRDQLARGHITLNCVDVAGLGVVPTGTAKDAWDSIQNKWGKSTDMRRSHAPELLNRTVYTKDGNVQDHIKLLHTRRAAVDNLSATPMKDKTW